MQVHAHTVQRAEVTTKAFTKETEALKALMDYEWTKIKMELQR